MMINQVSAGIVVYYKNNGIIEYLLLQYGAGHWDFVKGKLEEGETKVDAALRELEEETGLQEIELKPGFQEMLSYRFTDFSGELVQKAVYFFVGQVPSKKEIVLSREHQNYVWLPFEKALEQLTYQNAKEVLTEANLFLTRV